jgi:hypothetical protein
MDLRLERDVPECSWRDSIRASGRGARGREQRRRVIDYCFGACG